MSASDLSARVSSAKQLLILLLGGRIQPAAMLAFQRRPDAVVCIHSVDEPQTAVQLHALLRKRFPMLQLAPPIPVSAYQPEQTRTAIARALTHFPDHQPALSLTGAPMPMVIGAYAMAQRLACPAYYLNTADGQILDLAHEATTTAFTLHISVADYLAIHGHRWINQTKASVYFAQVATYDQAVQLLLADLPTTTALLDWMTDRHTLETPQRRVWQLHTAHWQLLEQLAQLGLCQNLEMAPTAKTTYVRFRVNVAAHRRFLQGAWLEFATAQIARGAEVFDDCTHNLIIRSGDAQREVDFMGVRRGQGMIASCKTGRRFWEKAHLDELGAAARTLGDNYCTKLLITSRSKPMVGARGAEALPQFLKHAANQRVVVVTGDELPKLGQILQGEIAKPRYARR